MAAVSKSNAASVLVVDYDVARVAETRSILEREGHAVVVARDSAMAATLADRRVGVLVVSDQMQLGPLRRLVVGMREKAPAMQVVLLAGARSGPLARETLEQLGAHSYVMDGDSAEALPRVVDAALRAHMQLSQAYAADRLKMELLAAVSHEFRSPLHIILGYLELAREGTFGVLADSLRDALDKVGWNAGQLLELVEDFLDLAKLETGGVRHERVDAAALVRMLVTDNELLVQGRPITLRAEVARGLPPVVADAAKLRVVLQNLLANALKFTERGEIVVHADAPLDGLVQIHVRDTGPGIPPEAREAVFELFRQLQPGDMRQKGIGLGLALARRFARAMGGDLTLESVVGEGSTFTLSLPDASAAERVPGVRFARNA